MESLSSLTIFYGIFFLPSLLAAGAGSSTILLQGLINHRMVKVNGINMHVAEMGEGPVVLLLHGFPDLWYTWRHQITFLAGNGYRAVAPDLRGYGDTTGASPEASSYTSLHVVGDLVALIDSLGEQQVYLVGHDWGAMTAWSLSTFRPERIKAFVCLSVPFQPRNPAVKPVAGLRASFGDDYYICRFQEKGAIEAEIKRVGTAAVLAKIITDHRKMGASILPKQNPFEIDPNQTIKLPSWFSQADLDYYVSKFNRTGFTGALNYYRALDLTWELTAPWTGIQVKAPVKFIAGELDQFYNTPGTKEYINGGSFKKIVPNLETPVTIIQGAAHFVHQEKADTINAHILDFLKKF